MKRWKSIASAVGSVALAFGLGAAQQLPNPMLRGGTLAVLGMAAGYAAKRTSETNPNGTPAETPWKKEGKP